MATDIASAESRYRALFHGTGDVVLVADEHGGYVDANQRATELLGYSVDALRGMRVADVVVASPEWTEAEYERFVRTGRWRGDVILRCADGSEIEVEALATSVATDAGPLYVSVLRDVAERREAERALERSEQRFRTLFDTIAHGVVYQDATGTVISANPAAERILGVSVEEMRSRGTRDPRWVAWRDDDSPMSFDEHPAAVAMRTGTEVHNVELAFRRAGGEERRWLLVSAVPELVHGHDRPVGVYSTFEDITERKRSDTEREDSLARERVAHREAEAAWERLRLLSDASELLAESLDYQASLKRLAELVTETIADVCLIDVLSDDGHEITRLAAQHRDNAQQPVVDKLFDYPPAPHGPNPAARVIDQGKPEHLPVITDEFLLEISRTDEQYNLLRELGCQSFMSLPLLAPHGAIGALTLVSTDPDRRYGANDVRLGEEIARRAAVRILNARLYEERDRTARLLQRSLLPATLPDIPGIALAARHVAAGDGNEVGGDFYDVFPLDTSSWAVTIGDVCGKGPEAAAVMGAVRHTLRALARFRKRPSWILAELNRALLDQMTDGRFCTVALARVEVRPEDVRITIACGGHPLPILVSTDGTARTVGRHGQLLGVLPDVRVVDTTVTLKPGDTLVFYTDGLTEQSGLNFLLAEQKLHQLLASTASLPVPQLVTNTIAEMLPDTTRPGDDTAVLAVRVARRSMM